MESHWPANAEDRDALAAATTEDGLRVALVNTDGGDLAAGERGQLCDPAREEHALRVFLDGVELAVGVGARSLHALVGRVPDGVAGSASRWSRRSGSSAAHADAAAQEVAVVVEALNPHDAPGYLTPSPEAALRLAEAVGAGVLLDAYHVARMGRDPAVEAARLAGPSGTCTSPIARAAARRERATWTSGASWRPWTPPGTTGRWGSSTTRAARRRPHSRSSPWRAIPRHFPDRAHTSPRPC